MPGFAGLTGETGLELETHRRPGEEILQNARDGHAAIGRTSARVASQRLAHAFHSAPRRDHLRALAQRGRAVHRYPGFANSAAFWTFFDNVGQ